MATRFATASAWSNDPTIYPRFDYLVELPGEGGLFPFRIADGRTPANKLPYAPNLAAFTIPPSAGGLISTPASTTTGNLVLWGDSTGTSLVDGPSPADFATAAQGALADTAVQPGDPLTDLSSGAAPVNEIPKSDGAGGIVWGAAPSGSGITQLTGPITAGPGSGSQATTVTPGAITNTMLANEPDQTFKGRPVGAGAGAPQDLTANQASSVLDTATDPFVRTSAIPASLNANKTMAYVATY